MKKLLIYSLFAVSFLGSGPVWSFFGLVEAKWDKFKANRQAKNKQEDLEKVSKKISETKKYLNFESDRVRVYLNNRNTKEQKYQERINGQDKDKDIRLKLRNKDEEQALVPLSEVYKAWHRCLRVLDAERDEYAQSNAQGFKRGNDFRIIIRKKGSLQFIEQIRTIKGLYDLHTELVEDYNPDDPEVKARWKEIKKLEEQVIAEAKALFDYMISAMGVNKEKLASDPKDTLRKIKSMEDAAAKAADKIKKEPLFKKSEKYNIQSALAEGERLATEKAPYTNALTQDYAGIPTEIIHDETIGRKRHCTLTKNTIEILAKDYFKNPSNAPYVTYLKEQVDESYARFIRSGFTIITSRVYLEKCNKEITKIVNAIIKRMQKAVDRADDNIRIRKVVRFPENAEKRFGANAKKVEDRISHYIGFKLNDGKIVERTATRRSTKSEDSPLLSADLDMLKSYLALFERLQENTVTAIKRFESEFDSKFGKKIIDLCQENPFLIKDSDAQKSIKENIYRPWAVLQMIKESIKGLNFNWAIDSQTLEFKREMEKMKPELDDKLFANLTAQKRLITADETALNSTGNFTLTDEAVEKEILEQDKKKAEDFLAKGAFRWHRVISDFKIGQTKRREFDFHLNKSWNPAKWLQYKGKSYANNENGNQFEEFGERFILALIIENTLSSEKINDLKSHYSKNTQTVFAKCLATEALGEEKIDLKNEITEPEFTNAIRVITEKFSHRYSIVYSEAEYNELDKACLTVSKALEFPYGDYQPEETSAYMSFDAAQRTVKQFVSQVMQLAILIQPEDKTWKEGITQKEALVEAQKELKKLIPDIADAEIDAIKEQVEKVLENFETTSPVLSLDATKSAIEAWMNSATKFQKAVEFYATALDAYCEIKPHPEIEEAVKELSHLKSKNMDKLAARYTPITLSLDAENSLEINGREQWEETKRLIKNQGPISKLASITGQLSEDLRANISTPLGIFISKHESGASVTTDIEAISTSALQIADLVVTYHKAQMLYQFAHWTYLTLHEKAAGPEDEATWIKDIATADMDDNEKVIVKNLSIHDEDALISSLSSLSGKLHNTFNKSDLIPFASKKLTNMPSPSSLDIEAFVDNYSKLKNWKTTTEKARENRIKADGNVLEAYRQALIALVTKIKAGRESSTEGTQANAALFQTKINDGNNWLSTPLQDLFKTSGTYASLGRIIEQTIQSNSLPKAAIDTVNTILARYKQELTSNLVVAEGFKSQLQAATKEVNSIASKIKNPKAQQRWRTAAEAVSATGAFTAAATRRTTQSQQALHVEPAVATHGDTPERITQTSPRADADTVEAASPDDVNLEVAKDQASQEAAGVVDGETVIHKVGDGEAQIQDTQEQEDRLEPTPASRPKTPPTQPVIKNPPLNGPAVVGAVDMPQQSNQSLKERVKTSLERLIALIKEKVQTRAQSTVSITSQEAAFRQFIGFLGSSEMLKGKAQSIENIFVAYKNDQELTEAKLTTIKNAIAAVEAATT